MMIGIIGLPRSGKSTYLAKIAKSISKKVRMYLVIFISKVVINLTLTTLEKRFSRLCYIN